MELVDSVVRVRHLDNQQLSAGKRKKCILGEKSMKSAAVVMHLQTAAACWFDQSKSGTSGGGRGLNNTYLLERIILETCFLGQFLKPRRGSYLSSHPPRLAFITKQLTSLQKAE